MSSIRQTRRRLGLSQVELAEAAGVSPATVVEIERGHRQPQGRTLRKLAAALGVEVVDLVEEEVDASPKAQAPLPLEDQKQWGPQALAAHINETAGALEDWSSLSIEKVEDPGDLPERAFLAFLGGLALALRSLERIKEIVDSRYRENGEILDEDVAKAWSRLTRTMHQFITPNVKRRTEELQDALPANVIHMWDRKTA